MSELDSSAPAVLPPPKRRRVEDDSLDSTPRYRSPSADTHDDQDQRRSQDKPHPSNTSLSILRGRPQSRSRSRSRSRSTNGDDDKRKRYRSSTPPSPGSRSRSPRSPYSPRSRSRSNSRSRSQSSSASRRRRHRTSDSRSRSRSTSSRRSQTHRLSQQPLSAPNTSSSHPPRPPLRPRYRRRLELRGHGLAISQVRISPDGRWIASASADGTAKIWSAETGDHIETLVGHMAGVSCIAWAPDSNTLATGSDDKAIRLWDRVTASPAHSGGDVGGRGSGATNGGGGGSGGRARTTRGAAATTGTMTTRGKGPLLGHHNYVYCLAFSPKGNILASGSYDEAVFLWDVRAGRLMRSLPAHSDPVSGIDFCRDGTLVVSCSTDGLIRIWDTSTGQCLRTLVHEDNPAVTNVCFSPNGRFVLAFSLDNSIRLWDFVSGSVKKTYQGHKNKGFSIGGNFAVLTDDEGDVGEEDGVGTVGKGSKSFVVSASEDGDIVLWDARSKEIVQRIEGVHKGVCFWVDVNGDTLVSAGQDGLITLFKHRPPRRRKVGALKDGGAEREVNGDGAKVNEEGDGDGGVITPYETSADDELQRQVEADAGSGSPMQVVKEERL